MLMGEKPLPWENLQSVDRKRLGEFRKPVLELLNRNPDQRPTMSQFYDNCNAIFFSNTTTKIGAALSNTVPNVAPPEAAAPLPNTASDSTPDSATGSNTSSSVVTSTMPIPPAGQAIASTSAAAANAGAKSAVNSSSSKEADGNAAVNSAVNSSTSKEADGSAAAETVTEDAAVPDGATDFVTLPLDHNLKIV